MPHKEPVQPTTACLRSHSAVSGVALGSYSRARPRAPVLKNSVLSREREIGHREKVRLSSRAVGRAQTDAGVGMSLGREETSHFSDEVVWGGKWGWPAERGPAGQRRSPQASETLGLTPSDKAQETRSEWLKRREPLLSGSAAWEPKVKVWQGRSPPDTLCGNPSCPFRLLVLPAVLFAL